MNWAIKINSENCPYKIYPTHTKNNNWIKGYCKITDCVAGIDKLCSKDYCPLKEKVKQNG